MRRRTAYQKSGQSTLEYVIIISVAIGALLTMQNYLKRGLQGHLREDCDQIGTQYSPGSGTKSFSRSAHEHISEAGLTRTTTSEGSESEHIGVSIDFFDSEPW
ncbi:MAG: hypothetical protein GF375_02030 [Candidatus Omnitrophica bacterium]|nr:hypothetical protein [Candidatus Omnitrophota bacterium]